MTRLFWAGMHPLFLGRYSVVRISLLIVLFVHSAFSYVAYIDHGYLGFFPPFVQSNTTQVFSDLVIALTLVNIWIYFDLRARSKPVLWMVLVLIGTLAMGSIAPLIYLLLRGGRSSGAITSA